MLKGMRLGVSMTRYIADHESKVRARISQTDLSPDELGALLRDHLLKIAWLQHERLIHLLVTMLVAVLLMFLFVLTMLNTSWPVLILLAIAAVLLVFYLLHYFNLENTVQRWYILADVLQINLENSKNQSDTSADI